MNTTSTKDLLLAFSARTGVSGMEGDAAAYAKALLEPHGAVEISPLGSVICTVRKPEPGGAHILLDAHIDEIGLIVTYITGGGFLRVANCGGVDRRLLMASPVTVHAASGSVPGVICSIPPHLQGAEEKKNPRVEDIHIDVGLSKESCEKLIRPGDRVTLVSEPRELLGGLICGKALDDRAGCVSLLKALDYLGEAPCGLTVVFSSMEEVGGQGAKTAAYACKPTHAVAVDVSYGHTPDSPREKCGLVGKGPMIGAAPILSRALTDRLIGLADEHSIPYQLEAMGGKTGTNADAIAVARGGVKTALLSIPLKYMHSPVEVVDPADVDNTGRLIAALVHDIAKGGRN